MGIDALRRAVFLDRDGVLIATPSEKGITRPPPSVREISVLPRVSPALKELRSAGFLLIVVTNQPDIARGTQTRANVDEINDALNVRFRFDGIYVCGHDDGDHCLCRKPAPGMLQKAAVDHNLSLENSYMVGDRMSDVLAGNAAGCKSILISASDHRLAEPRLVAGDLYEAVNWILQDSQTNQG